MASAAMSWSRMAMNARPEAGAEEVRATITASTARPAMTQYHCLSVTGTQPKNEVGSVIDERLACAEATPSG